MRITNNIILHNTSININGNKGNVDTLNNQMTSQKKIQRPSDDPVLRGFCSGILEMTNGAHLLSLSPDGLRLRLTLVAFLVSFGGLSILGQTFGVLAAMPISKKDYIKGKLINALFSSLSFFLLYPFFYPYAQKEVPAFFSLTETSFTLSFLWLLPSLFFLAVLCYAISRRG